LLPTFVTIARRPSLWEQDAAMSEGDLPDGTTEIFFRGGLDDPNHVESAHENSVYAHPISRSQRAAQSRQHLKIQLIWPVGQNIEQPALQKLVIPSRGRLSDLVRCYASSSRYVRRLVYHRPRSNLPDGPETTSSSLQDRVIGDVRSRDGDRL